MQNTTKTAIVPFQPPMLYWEMQVADHEENASRTVVITGAAGGIGSARAGQEDLVGAVYFLASEDAAFITGQIINVDGGAEFH